MVAYQLRMMIPKICTNDKTSMTIQINHGGQLEFQVGKLPKRRLFKKSQPKKTVGKRPKRRPVKFPPVTPTCPSRQGLDPAAGELDWQRAQRKRQQVGVGRRRAGCWGKTERLGEDG